jgi:hypothetical protein
MKHTRLSFGHMTAAFVANTHPVACHIDKGAQVSIHLRHDGVNILDETGSIVHNLQMTEQVLHQKLTIVKSTFHFLSEAVSSAECPHSTLWH